MTSRLRRLAVSAALSLLIVVGLVFDASARRDEWARSRNARLTRVAELGFVDLALSSSSRWLRNPSRVERTAAVADTASSLDTDPAAGWTPPPSALRGAP